MLIMEKDGDCVGVWFCESLHKWCTHTPLFFLCCVIHGVSMSTTLSYVFLGGTICNKCPSENVMLCSVNTGCEQWCNNLKKILYLIM